MRSSCTASAIESCFLISKQSACAGLFMSITFQECGLLKAASRWTELRLSTCWPTLTSFQRCCNERFAAAQSLILPPGNIWRMSSSLHSLAMFPGCDSLRSIKMEHYLSWRVSPVATSSPKQCSKPPQSWNRKHCKSVEFCQFLQCQAPCTDVEAPCQKVSGDGSVKSLPH